MMPCTGAWSLSVTLALIWIQITDLTFCIWTPCKVGTCPTRNAHAAYSSNTDQILHEHLATKISLVFVIRLVPQQVVHV